MDAIVRQNVCVCVRVRVEITGCHIIRYRSADCVRAHQSWSNDNIKMASQVRAVVWRHSSRMRRIESSTMYSRSTTWW